MRRNNSGPQCSIFTNSQRSEIDAELLRNAPGSAISQRFKCSAHAVWRHKTFHLKAEIKSVEATTAEARARIAEEIDRLLLRARKLQDAAQRKRDVAPQLAVIKAMQSLLEFQARILGATHEESGARTELHVHVSQEKALTLAQTFVTRHDDLLSASRLQLKAAKELAGECKTNVKVGVVNSDA